MLDAPVAARTIPGAHAEVRDREGRRVQPLHDHLSRRPIAHENQVISIFFES